MAEVAGVPGDKSGTSIAGARYIFANEATLGVVVQHTSDLFTTAYSEFSNARTLSENWGLQGAAQYTNQWSNGREKIGNFDTYSWGLRGALSFRGAVLTYGYTRTGDAAIRKPAALGQGLRRPEREPGPRRAEREPRPRRPIQSESSHSPVWKLARPAASAPHDATVCDVDRPGQTEKSMGQLGHATGLGQVRNEHPEEGRGEHIGGPGGRGRIAGPTGFRSTVAGVYASGFLSNSISTKRSSQPGSTRRKHSLSLLRPPTSHLPPSSSTRRATLPGQ